MLIDVTTVALLPSVLKKTAQSFSTMVFAFQISEKLGSSASAELDHLITCKHILLLIKNPKHCAVANFYVF